MDLLAQAQEGIDDHDGIDAACLGWGDERAQDASSAVVESSVVVLQTVDGRRFAAVLVGQAGRQRVGVLSVLVALPDGQPQVPQTGLRRFGRGAEGWRLPVFARCQEAYVADGDVAAAGVTPEDFLDLAIRVARHQMNRLERQPVVAGALEGDV